MANQKKNVVKQSTLVNFLSIKTDIKGLKGQLKQLEELLHEEELTLLRAHHTQTPIEHGTLVLEVSEKERRSVKWKEEFAAKLGAQAVEDALNQTAPTIFEHVEVVPRIERQKKSSLKSA